MPSLSPQRALSRVLFLTPYLPAFLLRHRLRSHVLEIQHLDRALLHLGLGQLSEEELRAVRTPQHTCPGLVAPRVSPAWPWGDDGALSWGSSALWGHTWDGEQFLTSFLLLEGVML